MSQPSSSCFSSSSSHMSNLQRFLDSVTPVIKFTSGCENDCNSLQDLQLKDIWENYDEWSACGVGTSVELENGERVTQYFIPYLSAIQIFMEKSPPTSRKSIEEKEMVKSPGSESLIIDGGKSDEPSILSTNHLSSKFSSSKNHSVAFGDLCGTQNNVPIDQIYFQFYENCLPYDRAPFANKISELSAADHKLMGLRIKDIAPASWMAVAWYPIYHIPAKGRVKGLSTCFLTFHTLSPSFHQESSEVVGFHVEGLRSKSKQKSGIALPPFGLASYKMYGKTWNNAAMGDEKRLKDLYSAACSWLKQLNAPHHDFYFFNSFSSTIA